MIMRVVFNFSSNIEIDFLTFIRLSGAARRRQDLSNFPIAVVSAKAAVLVGLVRPRVHKAYRKCDCRHYADRQQKSK